jgi:PEGA domain
MRTFQIGTLIALLATPPTGFAGDDPHPSEHSSSAPSAVLSPPVSAGTSTHADVSAGRSGNATERQTAGATGASAPREPDHAVVRVPQPLTPAEGRQPIPRASSEPIFNSRAPWPFQNLGVRGIDSGENDELESSGAGTVSRTADSARWTNDEGPSEQRELGFLLLVVAPVDASVYVDGKLAQAEPSDAPEERGLQLPAGSHHVEVVRPAHDGYEKAVTVYPGETTLVSVHLVASLPSSPGRGSATPASPQR